MSDGQAGHPGRVPSSPKLRRLGPVNWVMAKLAARSTRADRSRASVALLALSFSAIEGNTLGWTSAPIIGSAIVAIAAAAGFAWFERHAAMPML